MRKIALTKWISIIFFGCCLIMAALGAALYIGYATPSYKMITAEAAEVTEYWQMPTTCP